MIYLNDITTPRRRLSIGPPGHGPYSTLNTSSAHNITSS